MSSRRKNTSQAQGYLPKLGRPRFDRAGDLPKGVPLGVGGDCASKRPAVDWAVTCGVGPGGSGRYERCHGLLGGARPRERPRLAFVLKSREGCRRRLNCR
jgi:hypothetical protein